MPPAPQPAAPNAAPAQQGQGSRPRGHLLGLVRRILDYGRDLVAALQQQNAPTPSPRVAWAFGTIDLSVIIARLLLGLRIAEALETRLIRRTPTQEMPRVTRVRPLAKPRAAKPKPAEQPDNDLTLPSAEAIAARIKGRSAGAVIVEICRELGINAMHPMWREIQDAIFVYRGSMARMMTAWMRAAAYGLGNGSINWPLPIEPVWPEPAIATTGPP